MWGGGGLAVCWAPSRTLGPTVTAPVPTGHGLTWPRPEGLHPRGLPREGAGGGGGLASAAPCRRPRAVYFSKVWGARSAPDPVPFRADAWRRTPTTTPNGPPQQTPRPPKTRCRHPHSRTAPDINMTLLSPSATAVLGARQTVFRTAPEERGGACATPLMMRLARRVHTQQDAAMFTPPAPFLMCLVPTAHVWALLDILTPCPSRFYPNASR